MKDNPILIATSSPGGYSYWKDASDLVYERKDLDGPWIGYLCHFQVWLNTHALCCSFGPFSSFSECCDKQAALKSNGWEMLHIRQLGAGDYMDSSKLYHCWTFYAYAPNDDAIKVENAARLYNIVNPQ